MKKILLLFLSFPVLAQAQTITTIAGGASGSYVSGLPATATSLSDPTGVTFDRKGNLYITVPLNYRVVKVDQAGILTTFAGTGTTGFSGDGGPATAAKLGYPTYVAADATGNIYISDAANWRVRKVDTFGVITTFAGNGTTGYSGDNVPATSTSIYTPQGLNFDRHGNLFVADYNNYRIRKIDAAGIITTVAGNGVLGFSGDGGPATSAKLKSPMSVVVDTVGNLFIGDYGNNRVREVDTNGIIRTVAGNGSGTYAGDGIPATSASIALYAIVLDNSSNLYIGDFSNERIFKVDATSGIINTIAGNGTAGYSGDGGAATSAQIYLPEGLTFDVCGSLYIADLNNHRVRKVTYPPTLTTPSISLAGTASYPVGSTVTVTATVGSAGSSYIIHWMNHGLEFTTTTIPSVTYTKPTGVDTITARIVPTGYGCWDSTTSTAHIVNPSSTGASTSHMTALMVYPNPAHDALTIISPEVITYVSTYNPLGQELSTRQYNGRQVEVDVADLPAGVYFIRINGTEVRRFIKE